jgi:hypothetical protein
MKKSIIMGAIALSGIFYACSHSSKSEKETLVVAKQTDSIKYQCPMKCQGDTAYTTEGACPVCEMKLEKVSI